MLSPVYERVIAIDRSDAQIALARERTVARGFANVTLLRAELDGKELLRTVGAGADAVFASRVLHHASQPARVAYAQLASLCGAGGSLVLIDYARHDDESMRDQADAWLGFEPAALCRLGSRRRA